MAMTLRIEERMSSRTGPPIEKQTIVAVASDGSRATGTLDPNGDYSSRHTRGITLAAERRHVVVTPIGETVSSFYMTSDAAARLKWANADKDCRPNSAAPLTGSEGEPILGYRTIRYAGAPQKDPDGTSVFFTHWYAPALDCAPLRSLAEWKNADGTVVSKHENVAVDVRVGEPDPRWFDVPAWREAPPSESQRLELESQGRTPPESLSRAWSQQDEQYRRAQQYKPR